MGLRSVTRQPRASSQAQLALRKTLAVGANSVRSGDTVLTLLAVIRLQRQRVAVTAPDNRKTERTLAERRGVERKNGRGQRVHRTPSPLDERCCCGNFPGCGKSRCEGNPNSLVLPFIRTEEMAAIWQRATRGESELVVPKFRARAPKGVVIEIVGG